MNYLFTRPLPATLFLFIKLHFFHDFRELASRCALFSQRGRGLGTFPLQFLVIEQPAAIKAVFGDGLQYRAARFCLVTAIAEMAMFGQCLDVFENGSDGFAYIGYPQFPHTRHINQQSARRQDM